MFLKSLFICSLISIAAHASPPEPIIQNAKLLRGQLDQIKYAVNAHQVETFVPGTVLLSVRDSQVIILESAGTNTILELLPKSEARVSLHYKNHESKSWFAKGTVKGTTISINLKDQQFFDNSETAIADRKEEQGGVAEFESLVREGAGDAYDASVIDPKNGLSVLSYTFEPAGQLITTVRFLKPKMNEPLVDIRFFYRSPKTIPNAEKTLKAQKTAEQLKTEGPQL